VNVTFVLVRPKVPENVGACARAVHTMGFKSLRLVSPCDHLDEKAKWLAHGSVHVLEKAEVFDSAEEALKDVDFAVGTTARKRHALKGLYYPIQKLSAVLSAKAGAIRRAAFLFGCESFGLTNPELSLCDIVTYVPMAQRQPSLNLAQAVMIYAWELSKTVFRKKIPAPERPPEGQYKALKKRLETLLPRLDVRPEGIFHHKIMKRIGLVEKMDIRLLHFLCGRMEEALVTRISCR
jgi:tRNA/rRNA methyltransferase